MTQRLSDVATEKYSNSLNNLEGREWIKFTKTWFVLKAPPRKKKVIHPATFPENLASRFIEFFTKENEWVFDPFNGSGSSILAARNLNRNSIGIELYPEFVMLARRRINEISNNSIKSKVIQGDSRNISEIFRINDFPQMNFCITSPPYWNQLSKRNRTHERQENRIKCGLKTKYGNNKKDLGLIEDYNYYLSQLEEVFNETYEIMANGSYIVVITNNIYAQGRLWPIAFDTLKILSKRWIPKDEMIWCQDDKKLFPFGMFHSYVGNRSHQYCLIFKKQLE